LDSARNFKRKERLVEEKHVERDKTTTEMRRASSDLRSRVLKTKG